MKHVCVVSGLFLAGLFPIAASAADEHKAVSADELTWKQNPALPKGVEVAIVSGDPSKEGPYVLRLRAPAGLKVPPHFHPNDENGTVLSGTFNVGMGDEFDESKGQTVKAGGFVIVPKEMHHYAWFEEDTVIQFHGTGPGGVTYVNPSDDPRKTQ